MNAKMLSLTLAAGALMVQLTAAEQPAAAPAAAKPATPAAAAPAAEKPAQNAEQKDIWSFLPPVVARVNGKDITKQEFVDVMTAQLKGPDGKIPPMITAELLERVAPMQVKAFVDQKLLLAAAEKAGFKPSAELVKNTMKEQLDAMPKEQREMVKLQLQMTGKSEDAYIDEMAKNPTIQESFAIERYLDKTVVSKITVADAEAKAYYDANVSRFKEPADPANTIRASHILISTPDKATKEQLDAAKAKAEAILADLKKNPAGFEAAAHGAGAVQEDTAAEKVGHSGFEGVVDGDGAAEDQLADLHFQQLVLEVGAGAVGPVTEGGLVAGHEHVLQFMHDILVHMAHIHVEWRAGTLHLFLEGALDLVVAHAVFPHGIVFAHEAFADGADFVGAGAVDAVHAGAAVALGFHGGALIGVEFGDGRAGVIAEHHACARVVGVHPHVVGIVRGVVVAAGGRTALSGNHGLGEPSTPQALPPSVRIFMAMMRSST